MFKIKYVFLILLPLLLIGCQTTSPKNQSSSLQQWQTRQQELQTINTFQVNGTIAYFSDRTKSYGRFLLVQKAANNYQIKLTSPVGTNLLTLTVQPTQAELIDKDGKRYSEQNVENLMQKVSNINIPFNSLHSWLKGLSDNPNYDKLDDQGRLIATSFMQNNNQWQMQITNYMTRSYNNKDIDLPATIELTHQDERVRLRLDNWILR